MKLTDGRVFGGGLIRLGRCKMLPFKVRTKLDFK